MMITNVIISPLKKRGGLVFEQELTNYLSGLTTELSKAQKVKLNTLIKSIKSGLGIANLSDAFDTLQILAGETSESSLKNLVKNAHHATLFGAVPPSFTALEGWVGGGYASGIDSNYNPVTSGVNYLLHDASWGLYIRTDTVEVSWEIYNDVSHNYMLSRYGTNKMEWQLNWTIPMPAYTNSDARGMYIATGEDAGNQTMYKNKVPVSQSATVQNGLYDANFKILNFPTYECTKQVAAYFAGKCFTAAQVGVITDAIEAYMDSNEKGIIP